MNTIFNIEIHEQRDALESLRSEWDELACENARSGLCCSAAWYLSWLDNIDHKSKPLVIAVRDNTGNLVGVAPLCKKQYRFRGLNFTAIGFGGCDVVCGDYLDILTAGDRPSIMQAVLDRLWELRGSWNLFIVGDVVSGGDLQLKIKQWAKDNNIPNRPMYDMPGLYIELPRTFEDYVGGLSKSVRYSIRRNTQAVKKLGAYIETYTEPEQVVAHLDTLIRLHEARWRKADQPGVLGYNGFPEFLRHVILSSSVCTQCRLYLLMHEGQAVAAELVFYFGESAFFYQTGYDPKSPVARASPGLVLMQQAMKDTIDHGLRYFDFMRGDELYKYSWTQKQRTITMSILIHSRLTRIFFYITNIMSWIKNRGRKPPYAPKDV